MKITWLKPEEVVEYELRQLTEEGKDVSDDKKDWETAKDQIDDVERLRKTAEAFLDRLATLQIEGPDEEEPTELSAIQRKSLMTSLENKSLNQSAEEIFHRVLGGWLGRAAGCLLGKPVEKITREGIQEILVASGRWPLNDYFTEEGIPEPLLAKYPWNRHGGRESLKENIQCMPEDDDTNFPMLNLYIAETYGKDFTTEDVATAWLDTLPVMSIFTAERVAYYNCLSLIEPPQTARYRNPYREWIGAQIRADFWGWICPGEPEKAAELAYRDAAFTHVKNGIYGEMFIAATIAAAFGSETPLQAIESGLAQIPQNSRLAHAIRYALDLPKIEPTWEGAVDLLYQKYGDYHWVHTINNAALLTAALIYGQGDFEKTICNVVMAGWDTDCNGATVGSILGVLMGAEKLPKKWIEPLNNQVRSSLKGFDYAKFDDLAQRTCNFITL